MGGHVVLTESEDEKTCSLTRFLTRNFLEKHCGLSPENVELCRGWDSETNRSSGAFHPQARLMRCLGSQVCAVLTHADLEVTATFANPVAIIKNAFEKKVSKYCT